MQLLRIEDVETIPEEKVLKLIQFLQEEKIDFKMCNMTYIGK